MCWTPVRQRPARCPWSCRTPRGWANSNSAKLEVLLDSLREVQEEGHKALVFSQFLEIEHVSMDAEEPLKLELAHFVDCVREGREPLVGAGVAAHVETESLQRGLQHLDLGLGGLDLVEQLG